MRKLLKKFVIWVMRDEDDSIGETISTRPSRRNRVISSSESELRSNGMVFHLYAAEGGTVIETTFYDHKEDKHDHRLYIIPEGEDFTSTLGQIVSMERMKSWH